MWIGLGIIGFAMLLGGTTTGDEKLTKWGLIWFFVKIGIFFTFLGWISTSLWFKIPFSIVAIILFSFSVITYIADDAIDY